MFGSQIVITNIFEYFFLFFGIECTAVDDDALARIIAHHVAVFLQHIALESLDFKHS